MKHILIYIQILLVAFSFTSCKKSAEYVPPPRVLKSDYLKFSTIGMQYIKLPVKAYYIYRDSAMGVLDSVVVTETSLQKNFSPAHTVKATIGWETKDIDVPGYYFEKFNLILTKYMGSTSQVWLSLADSNSWRWGSLYDNVPDSGIQLQNALIPLSSNYFSYGSIYSPPNIIPSMTIEGKTYTDVVRAYNSYNGGSRDFYWAKGIGLIMRREITISLVPPFNATSTQTWTLIRNG